MKSQMSFSKLHTNLSIFGPVVVGATVVVVMGVAQAPLTSFKSSIAISPS